MNIRKECDNLVKWMMNYWEESISTFGVHLRPFVPVFNVWTPGDTKFVKSLPSGRFESLLQSYIEDEMVCIPSLYGYEDNTISTVKCDVYYSCEVFYSTLLKLGGDYSKFKDYITLPMRHEIGHVLQLQEFVGKPYDDYKEFSAKAKEGYSSMPKRRKNSSAKKELERWLKYNQLPCEADANSRVGITEEDLIKSFWMVH